MKRQHQVIYYKFLLPQDALKQRSGDLLLWGQKYILAVWWKRIAYKFLFYHLVFFALGQAVLGTFIVMILLSCCCYLIQILRKPFKPIKRPFKNHSNQLKSTFRPSRKDLILIKNHQQTAQNFLVPMTVPSVLIKSHI